MNDLSHTNEQLPMSRILEAVESQRAPPAQLMTSYAQNGEDVLLQRLFRDVAQGFYVDIGAADPIVGSVTKHFYDRGWSGINFEPGLLFEKLAAARPRDINLNVVVLDHSGSVDFFDDTADLGTSRVESAETRNSRKVRCERLDDVLAERAPGRAINFLKIDAEGSEFAIITSIDWGKVRPQVLVIEAVAPWTNELISGDWEPHLLESGYKRAYFDGINLFFVRAEDDALLRHFNRPVNVLDWFEKYDPLKAHALDLAEEKHAAAQMLQERLNEKHAFAEALLERFENWARQLNEILLKRRKLAAGRSSEQNPDEIVVPEQLLNEVDLSVIAANELDHLAERINLVLAMRRVEKPTGEMPPIDQLMQEIQIAIEVAMRYDRLVSDLRDPAAPKSLRLLLPIARVMRSGRNAVARRVKRPAAACPVESGTPMRSTFRSILRVLTLPLKAVVTPITGRVRAYLLAPIAPRLDRIDALAHGVAHDVAFVRQVLADAQRDGTLSPELVKSINALLVTNAVSDR